MDDPRGRIDPPGKVLAPTTPGAGARVDSACSEANGQGGARAGGGKRGPSLADLISQRREEIVQRFVEEVKARGGAAESLPPEQVINSLREFLDELAGAIRSQGELGPEHQRETSASATSHGQQRFGIGYDVAGLVREYSILRELLFDIVEESGTVVSVRESRSLAKYFIGGIADAATRYGAVRDEALRKRTAEHIGFLAHELRNPLGSVKLAFEVMRQRGDVPASPVMGAIERGLHRLSALIDDALVNIRLQQADVVHRQPMDVRQFLSDIATENSAELEVKGQRVAVEGSATLNADAKVLRSALSNLVRNAVKFTPPGGHIHLRVKQSEGRVTIEVEDSCGGLPPHKAETIFDPFVQVGLDRSGFGLGLAIAKQAVTAHGGELRVHDLPGKGCVFVLDIPEAAADAA